MVRAWDSSPGGVFHATFALGKCRQSTKQVQTFEIDMTEEHRSQTTDHNKPQQRGCSSGAHGTRACTEVLGEPVSASLPCNRAHTQHSRS